MKNVYEMKLLTCRSPCHSHEQGYSEATFQPLQGGPGSGRLRFARGTVRADPVFGSDGSSKEKVFCAFQCSSRGWHGSGSGFSSWKMVPTVAVLISVPGKTVPTVPVSGSGSVPVPSCPCP